MNSMIIRDVSPNYTCYILNHRLKTDLIELNVAQQTYCKNHESWINDIVSKDQIGKLGSKQITRWTSEDLDNKLKQYSKCRNLIDKIMPLVIAMFLGSLIATGIFVAIGMGLVTTLTTITLPMVITGAILTIVAVAQKVKFNRLTNEFCEQAILEAQRAIFFGLAPSANEIPQFEGSLQEKRIKESNKTSSDLVKLLTKPFNERPEYAEVTNTQFFKLTFEQRKSLVAQLFKADFHNEAVKEFTERVAGVLKQRAKDRLMSFGADVR